MGLEHLKQFSVENHTILDNFCPSFAIDTLWQRQKHCRIDHHQPGLVISANEILAQRVIDTRFAADSGINLGEQRRRNLDQRHTALIARSHEAGQVANNATSYSNDRLPALGLMLHEPVKDLLEVQQ